MRRTRGAIRVLRALWRYRGEIEQQGRDYQVELATLVGSRLRASLLGRAALTTYSGVMRLLVILAAVLVVAGTLLSWAAWDEAGPLRLAAAIPLLLAGPPVWWWLTIGAPLRWLREHEDLTRSVQLRDVPARMRALARDTRTTADARSRLAQHLEDLASET